MKVLIEEDSSCEMLWILNEEGNCVFSGNQWDLDRSGDSLKSLFKDLGLEVDLVEVNADI